MKPTSSSLNDGTTPPESIVEVWHTVKQRKQADAWLKLEHRLGVFKPIGDTLYQVILEDSQPVALLVWSASSWHLKDRDQWIGWDARLRVQRLKLVVNNVRFLI